MEADETPADDWVARLNRELAPALERVAWSILRDWDLAADATQEAFLLLASKSDSIPPERRKAWLVRTVQLQAQNLRRQHHKHGGRGNLAVDTTSLVGLEQQVCPLEQAEQLAHLQQAIGELPVEQQTVLHARLIEQETFARIAEKQNVPLGTVLSRMRLAVSRLRQRLKSEHDDHPPTDN